MKNINTKTRIAAALMVLFSSSISNIGLLNAGDVSAISNSDNAKNTAIINSGEYKVLELEKVLDIDFPLLNAASYPGSKYSATQGFTITNDYYAVALIGSQSLTPEAGEQSRDHNYTKVMFYRRSDNSLVGSTIDGNAVVVTDASGKETKVSESGHYMRHANDMAFDESNNEILVIDGGQLWHYDASNFSLKSNVYLKSNDEDRRRDRL